MSPSSALAQVICRPVIADLSLTKTVNNATPTVGGRVTFTVTVTNHGPDQATNVAVADSLPAGVTFVSANASQGAYNASTGVWTVGSLDDDISATLRITATVASSTVTNTAQVSASDQGDADSTPNNNDPTEDDQDSVTVSPKPPIADLSLTKTVSDATPAVNGQVSFTVQVTNVGPQAATKVAVKDLLPAGLTFVSASPSQGSYNASTGVWTVGTLDDDDSATLQITATVASSTVTNTAQVSASDQDDPDSTPDNNDPTEDDQASVSVTPKPVPPASPPADQPGMPVDNQPAAIVGNPAPAIQASSVPASTPAGSPQVVAGAQSDSAKLSIRKRSTRASVASGRTVRFQITVRSLGRIAALDVRVCDRLPSGLTYVRAAGARFRNGVACWTIARLAPGAVRRFSITARADLLVGGNARRIRNVATADASNTPKVTHAASVRVRPGRSAVLASGVTG